MPYNGEDYGGTGSRTSSWDEYKKYLKKYGGGGREGAMMGQNVARGIFGGPVGWAEIAQGKGFLGGSDPFSGSTVSDLMTEDIYNSMSPEEWAYFAKMNGQEQADFIAGKQRELKQYGANKSKADAELASQAAEKAKRDKFQGEMIQRLDAFAKEMGMSVDQLMKTDDYAKALNQSTYARTAADMYGSGVGMSGMGTAQADINTKNALLGYQMQRQQAGAAATQNAFSMMGAMSGSEEERRRYEQGMNLQLQGAAEAARMRNYSEGLARQQQQGALLGGIAGYVIGGPTGASFGSQLGGGIAGSNYKPYQAASYQYPTGATGSNSNYGYKPLG